MQRRRRGNWSVHELERLRALYPRVPESRLARLLGRSVQSVQRRAREMFARAARRGEWTAAEERMLRDAYGVLQLRAIALVLARPVAEIRRRAALLRSRCRQGEWSPGEETRLKRLYGSRSDADLEVCLSRSRADIAAAASRLCLSKDKGLKVPRSRAVVRPMPRWSLADTALLRELYTDQDNLEIARRLGRTVTSVANKASQLGLRKSPSVLRRMGRRNVGARYRDPVTVGSFDAKPDAAGVRRRAGRNDG